ncbi:MAG: hypothetical protein ACYC6G_10500 [Desulfobaccales bacterium]
MLEAILFSGTGGHSNQDDHIRVSKFRHNDKASYEVVIDAELDAAGMDEFINHLIAMRDGK